MFFVKRYSFALYFKDIISKIEPNCNKKCKNENILSEKDFYNRVKERIKSAKSFHFST